MNQRRPISIDEAPNLPGPFDREEEAEPWFLPSEEDSFDPVPLAPRRSLLDAAGWRAAEAGLAAELVDLALDLGRLAERLSVAGPGALQRLALAEAGSLSWWHGDRVAADQLALWLSYRIGAAEEGGEGLIRTAWAARRLMVPVVGGVGEALAATLGGARQAVVCRELTKRFEEVLRGDLATLAEEVATREIKGEIVVLVDRAVPAEVTEESIVEALDTALRSMSVKDAATFVSQTLGVSRKIVYRIALDRSQG